MTLPHAAPPLLADLAIVLGTAAVVAAAFDRLKIPPILGYVLAGLVVGPHVPIPLVANQENVQTLSELGVILLMFTIGLEFNARKLLRAGPRGILVVSVQAGAAFSASFLVARSFGWSDTASLFTGSAMCISSTMIASRLLEAVPAEPGVRDSVFSVLVIQDLLAILLLTGLGTASGAGGVQMAHLGQTLFRLFAFAGTLVAVGLLLVPRFVRWVADRQRDEALVVLSVGLCFALAYAAARFGYSPALGAFLGGTLISESGRVDRVQRLVHPLRDLFSAIFFVSVGMLMDPRPLPGLIGPILAFSALLLLFTPFSVAAACLLGGRPFRVGFHTGIVLGQVGEFSFVILGAGLAGGLFGPELFTTVVAVSAVTLAAASYLNPHAERLARLAEARIPPALRLRVEAYLDWLQGLDVRHTRRILPPRARNHLLLALAETGALVALLAAAFRLAETWTFRLEAWERWNHAAALTTLWACILAVGALLVWVIERESLKVARFWLASPEDAAPGLEPSSSTGSQRRMLQTAVLLGLGLPSVAVLQVFIPAGTGWFLLGFVGLLFLGLLAWKSRLPSRS